MIEIDNIDNAIFLKSLYPEGISFEGNVSDVVFSYEGPSIQMSFHLAQMPNMKPKKWQPEANRVLIVLEFIEVSQLSFVKWGRMNNITLEYERQEGYHKISIKGADCELSFNSKWINLKSISPYIVAS